METTVDGEIETLMMAPQNRKVSDWIRRPAEGLFRETSPGNGGTGRGKPALSLVCHKYPLSCATRIPHRGLQGTDSSSVEWCKSRAICQQSLGNICSNFTSMSLQETALQTLLFIYGALKPIQPYFIIWHPYIVQSITANPLYAKRMVLCTSLSTVASRLLTSGFKPPGWTGSLWELSFQFLSLSSYKIKFA